jgi:hypothetical protein
MWRRQQQHVSVQCRFFVCARRRIRIATALSRRRGTGGGVVADQQLQLLILAAHAQR